MTFVLIVVLYRYVSVVVLLTSAYNWLVKTLKEWKSRLHHWGYEPVFCSVDTKRGLDTLQFILREQTSVIVGPSGVGKSSLINALRGNSSVLGAAENENRFEPVRLPFVISKVRLAVIHCSIFDDF